MFSRSKDLFEQAGALLVGGVNSPVRAFKGVGGTPIFMASGHGSRITDEDGNSYIDYVLSWGPLILGHAHPAVVEAAISAFYPSLEKMRFTSSGTEAVMGAIRAARGFTGRNKVLKFEGCYHGGADYLLVKAGSGAATLGTPDSAGIPPSFAAETIVVPYNDIRAVEHAFAAHGQELAAVIVEPVAGNMGLVLPEPGFLDALRNLCTHFDSVLIFDEVLVGFRIKGGAQGWFQIKPDLTCLGKVIGGGFPVGCYGGRREIMNCVAPEGPVYQAGTLSGNPVAMAAGLATLEELGRPGVIEDLDSRTETLTKGMKEAAKAEGVALAAVSIGCVFGFFFRAGAPRSWDEVKVSDAARFKRFFHAMLRRGVYLAPSAFESGFLSTAHSFEDIDKTLAAFRESLRESGG